MARLPGKVQGVVVQITAAAPAQRRPDGAQDRETHPDSGRFVVVILDFRLGQGGLLDDRPQYRLRSFVQRAIEQKLADLANDLRLGRIGHRRVGIVPIADDTEPLEVALLHLDPMRREFAALAAELVDRHTVLRLLLGPVLLLDNPFDRQAVAVPARHIRRVLAEHLLGAVDHILEDLVERGAEMNVAVGVGRSVVQNKFLAPARRLAQPAIEVHFLPAREDQRLAVWQVPPHREPSPGQKDGRTIIRRHGQSTFWSEPGK